MSNADDGDSNAPAPMALRTARDVMAALKPKGSCWYCNQPVDNIRRFCSKTCADDFRTEEEAFNSPPT